MKKLTFMLFLFGSQQLIAQEKAKDFSEQIGITASTTAAYRITGTDTTLKSALTLAPYFRIMHKSGIGFNYSLNSLASGTGKKLFMHTASVFYEEYEKPLNLNFSLTHFFFTNNPAIPYTPISNELYGYMAYKKLWLAPAIATSIGFGQDENSKTQTVVNFSAGVTHNFNFNSKGFQADIAPSLFLNGGSNKYYSFLQNVRYITKNTGSKGFLVSNGKGKGRGNGNGSGGTTTTTTTTTNQVATNNFKLNNVELNLYSSFKMGHFEIVPDGSIFFPLKSSEQVSAYWELKLAYNF